MFRCGTPPLPGERLWVGDVECVMGTDGQAVPVTLAQVRPSLPDRLADRLFCTACLRLRCSPGHFLLCGQPRNPPGKEC